MPSVAMKDEFFPAQATIRPVDCANEPAGQNCNHNGQCTRHASVDQQRQDHRAKGGQRPLAQINPPADDDEGHAQAGQENRIVVNEQVYQVCSPRKKTGLK